MCVCAGGAAALSYTALYNVLNFPAGVVPVTEVTAEDEDQLKHYRGYFGDGWDKTFVEVNMTHGLFYLVEVTTWALELVGL